MSCSHRLLSGYMWDPLRVQIRWRALLVVVLLVGWGTAASLTHAQIYVDAEANAGGDGASWSTAYTDLQDALSDAGSTDEIWIAEGTYTPSRPLDAGDARTATFEITGAQDGLQIYGGFAGTETTRSERDPAANETILSGDIGTIGNASDNAYHVLVFNGGNSVGASVSANLTTGTVLDGMTVTGGNANGNGSSSSGGGLYCDGAGTGNACSPALTGLTFTGNAAEYGGAIYNNGGLGESSPQITNVVFTGNTAVQQGGAIFNNARNGGTSSPQITSSTFTGNAASFDGGAIYNDGSDGGTSSPQVTNTILWGNDAFIMGDEIYNDAATLTLAHTLIEGGLAGISENNGSSTTDGGSNLDADPLFVDANTPAGEDGIPGTADDGLRFELGSPVLNAGDNSAIPAGITTDLIGEDRIQGGTVSLGAYERGNFTEGPLFFVNGSASGDGSSFANGLSDLQYALDVATGSDVILIAAGTYLPSRELSAGDARTATFEVTGEQDGLRIYGGWSGSETFSDVSEVEAALDSRDLVAHETILSGDLNGDDETGGDNSENAYRVLVLNGGDAIGGNVSANITPGTVLDGLTITGGNANSNSFPNNAGGGLFCDGAGSGNACSPSLSGLTFTGNIATDGGAIYNNARNGGTSSPQITSSTFTGNAAPYGGAISNNARNGGTSSPVVTNATFTGNAAEYGGAIFNDARNGGSTSSPQITNATFTGNTAGNAGGAIYNRAFSGTSSPQITNVVFTGNTAGFFGGGAIYNYGTFGTSSPQITNTILWGNDAPDGNEIYNRGATPTLAHTLIEGGLAGISENDGSSTTDGGNNLDADPLFVDANTPAGEDGIPGTADDGLRLQGSSPALNAGNNSAIPAGIDTDLLGEARIQDGTVSLGAYEQEVIVARLRLMSHSTVEISTTELVNLGGAGVTGATVDLGLPAGVSATAISGDGSVSESTWTVDVPAQSTATVRVAYERDASAAPGLLDLTATLDTDSYTIDGGAKDATQSDDATADWALLEAPYGSGTALAFDGSADYLRMDGSAEDVDLVGASFTVEAWIQVDDLTGDNPILGHGDSSPGDSSPGDSSSGTNQVLYLTTRGTTLHMGFFNNDLGGSASLEEGRWHHAAFVYDAANGEQRIYLDGALDGTRSANAFAGGQSDPLQIGRWGGSRYLDGALDELRIWTEARTEADIQATMHQTLPTDTPELVASYRFDAAQTSQRLDDSHSGPTAYDLTGGRDAAFTGDPQWTASGAPLGQESVVVAPATEGTIGTNGQALTATVTSTTGRFTLYRYGDATAEVFDGDALPGGKTQRTNLVWGAVPGNADASNTAAADLTLSYGDVTVPNPGAVGLARRPGPAQPWTARAEEPASETFTITGQATPQEVALYDNEGIILYVDAEASGGGTGTSWTDAFTDLQEALDAAFNRDVILIAAGTYLPSRELSAGDARSATFEVTGAQDGLKIYGGWSGSETFADVSEVEAALDSRDFSAHETTLSGDIGTTGNASDNAYHVLVFNGGNAVGADTATNLTTGTVLDGVTVTGGHANGNFPNNAGGGLFCDGLGAGNACSPSLSGLTFTGNIATAGGAMVNWGGDGGESSPQITNVVFTGNTAGNAGGAIYNVGRNGTSSPVVTNATFTGNTAGNFGGGAINNNGSDGGTSSPVITNTILWGNDAPDGNEIYNGDATPTLAHTLIEGGLAGISENSGSSTTDGGSNLDADPLFVDANTPAGEDGIPAPPTTACALNRAALRSTLATTARFQPASP
ncbi:MAG: LamG-like jellyroll fold domain-containing protein, partial [Longimonas sp.]